MSPTCKIKTLQCWCIYYLSLGSYVFRILEVRTDNGDGNGITLGFMVEYILTVILVLSDGFSLGVSELK